MARLGRDTAVTGPVPRGIRLLKTSRGEEALGRSYQCELGLLSPEPSLDPDEVLGRPLAVSIRLGIGDQRFLHGIVARLTRPARRGSTRATTRSCSRN